MSTMNQIFRLKLEEVEDCSSINFANTLNIAPVDTSKTIGGSSPIGDCPVNMDAEQNIYWDPDVMDLE
ncbi:spore germination protein [Lihuaxuella thermophila]|uniref:Spore germination protein gerPA/gerPF n=1 Tax=Lihuaxuella thermophila TaxID=1173111 RepID=A0A1H8IUA3_9BACL|nr:spore germination protein [Lihuaxuella thermophila]SEN72154.1 Spore germination protein gerPA/gerPF [Lihuaxuella thermophila]